MIVMVPGGGSDGNDGCIVQFSQLCKICQSRNHISSSYKHEIEKKVTKRSQVLTCQPWQTLVVVSIILWLTNTDTNINTN